VLEIKRPDFGWTEDLKQPVLSKKLTPQPVWVPSRYKDIYRGVSPSSSKNLCYIIDIYNNLISQSSLSGPQSAGRGIPRCLPRNPRRRHSRDIRLRDALGRSLWLGELEVWEGDGPSWGRLACLPRSTEAHRWSLAGLDRIPAADPTPRDQLDVPAAFLFDPRGPPGEFCSFSFAPSVRPRRFVLNGYHASPLICSGPAFRRVPEILPNRLPRAPPIQLL
jgi:hypothetical protein